MDVHRRDRLQDELSRSVSHGIGVWARDGGFMVEGAVLVDDPPSTRGGGGNQRTLREVPDVHTDSLDEVIKAVEQITADFCGYESVLDELGVSRTGG